MDRMTMRDMARRDRAMRRNPYGSRGGYVVSDRRSRRDGLMMEDMRRYNAGESDYELSDLTRQNRPIEHDPYVPYMTRMGSSIMPDMDYRRGDYARTNRDYTHQYSPEYDMRYIDSAYSRYDNARGRRDYESMGQYGNDGTRYDFNIMGEYTRDGHYYPMDYARMRGSNGRFVRDRARYDMGYDYAGNSGQMLSDDELMQWSKKLMSKVDEKDKAFFTIENIKKKAQEMGIKFEEFTFEEFYTTVLMMYTDYCKTLGSANMDIYLRLAKDWLCDEDVDMQYGEKLAAYHDYVVKGM